jgi:hypothetical protein
MTLSIYNYLLFFLVFDENNNSVCKIKSRRFLSAEKEIYNSDNEVVYTTNIINSKEHQGSCSYSESRKYVANCSYDTSNIAAIASLVYPTDTKQTMAERFGLKLPQVDELNIQSIYDDIHINRFKDGSFSISNNEKTIGSISKFIPFKSTTIFCDTIKDPGFLAVLFALTLYMIHEDDLYVA